MPDKFARERALLSTRHLDAGQRWEHREPHQTWEFIVPRRVRRTLDWMLAGFFVGALFFVQMCVNASPEREPASRRLP